MTIGDAADAVNAEWAAEGTYVLTSPKFLTAGPIELVFSITGEAGEDLLAGTLTVPSDAMASAPGASTIGALRSWLTSLVSPLWQMVLLAIATHRARLVRRLLPAAALFRAGGGDGADGGRRRRAHVRDRAWRWR